MRNRCMEKHYWEVKIVYFQEGAASEAAPTAEKRSLPVHSWYMTFL